MFVFMCIVFNSMHTVCIYICTYTILYIHTYVYMYVGMYVCICVSKYVPIVPLLICLKIKPYGHHSFLTHIIFYLLLLIFV